LHDEGQRKIDKYGVFCRFSPFLHCQRFDGNRRELDGYWLVAVETTVETNHWVVMQPPGARARPTRDPHAAIAGVTRSDSELPTGGDAAGMGILGTSGEQGD
jgi:hypothetical protein